MASYNKIQIAGKLVDQPDSKVTTSGHALSKFTLIVPRLESLPNKRFDYIRVTAWRDNADKASNFQKDDIIYVDGRILTNSYEDESTGQRKWTTEVEARNISSFSELFELSNSSHSNTTFTESADTNSDDLVENVPIMPVKENDFFNEAQSNDSAPNIEDAFPSNPVAVDEIKNELEEDVPF